MSDRDADTVASLLGSSFDLMLSEIPDAYGNMCRHLAGTGVDMHIDQERFSLYFNEQSVQFKATECALSVRTDTQAILDHVDGRTDLYTALMDGTLHIQGELSRIVDLQKAFLAYLNGGLRCPEFPNLLDRLRALHGARTDTKER